MFAEKVAVSADSGGKSCRKSVAKEDVTRTDFFVSNHILMNGRL
jgi:hypothetical protein